MFSGLEFELRSIDPNIVPVLIVFSAGISAGVALSLVGRALLSIGRKPAKPQKVEYVPSAAFLELLKQGRGEPG